MKKNNLTPDVMEAKKKTISQMERESKYYWNAKYVAEFGKTLLLKGHRKRK